MFERDNRGLQTFFGGNTNGANAPSTTGNTGFTTFQIVLDTTTPLWNFAFEKNGTAFTTGSFSTNPAITNIGIGNISGLTGSYQSLSVTSTPEPGAGAVVLLGGAGLLSPPRARGASSN